MSQAARSNRGHRERNGDPRRQPREPRDGERSSDDRSSSRAPYYDRDPEVRQPKPARDREREREREREAARVVERHDSKCTHMCSRRGIVLICSVLTNGLVLICVVAAQMVTSGLSSMGGLGGFDINSNFNLQGTELQKVRELDMQYSQMRAPGIYGGVAFSLTMGVVSLLFVVAGNKPPQRLSRKLLYGALAFQALGGVAYVAAVALYLHFVTAVNATDVCRQRERLYARNGYTWMNCNVSGADAAVALFGLITAILYAAGTVLTVQTVRRVKRYARERERERREAERERARSRPLRAETSSV
ncbi:MARVEL domain-containing protein 3 [Festucalex cinctus]